MKQSNEESLSEAEAHIAREGRDSGHVFKAIQSWTTGERSEARVLTVRSDRDLDFPGHRSADEFDRRQRPRRRHSPRRAARRRAAGIADCACRSHPSKRRRASAATGCVASDAVRALRLQRRASRPDGAQFETRAQHSGRRNQYRDVIESSFDSKSRATGLVAHFQIAYGTTGSLAEIPVHAVYQPRRWLEVQLFLDDDKDF